MNDRSYLYYELMHSLRFVKFLHDIGIYEESMKGIREISEDDYYELALRGLSSVAPVFEIEELDEDVCCGGHVVYHFSDPAIPEYYRLCRLYEHKYGIAPKENPYVKAADNYFVRQYDSCCYSDFGAYYHDEVHVREICIEICPERPVEEWELIELVYDMLEYYRREAETLRAELLRGPVVWLPALPEHKRQTKAKKPRKKADKPLKKAS